MNRDNQPHWAICYHTNSLSPRGQKWYYIARVAFIDGKWRMIYRCQEIHSMKNLVAMKHAAVMAGYNLLNGTFTHPKTMPYDMNDLIWSKDEKEQTGG